jgi:cobalamin biosynthesis Co2+ chelatase CbiK
MVVEGDHAMSDILMTEEQSFIQILQKHRTPLIRLERLVSPTFEDLGISILL